jgi:hypothetical protein
LAEKSNCASCRRNENPRELDFDFRDCPHADGNDFSHTLRAFMRLWINNPIMISQQAIMADLGALPATALQKVADFVHQMRDTAAADRQAAFDASFGCMTAEEADAFERVIEDGCERIES